MKDLSREVAMLCPLRGNDQFECLSVLPLAQKNTPFLSTSILPYLSNKWGAVQRSRVVHINAYYLKTPLTTRSLKYR